MNRVKAILAAGTLTGLVLVTILALSLGNATGASADGMVAPTTITQPAAGQNLAGTQPGYTAQLEQSLQTMQAREAQYQAQIEQANQTIMQMQSQPQAPQPRTGFVGGGGERERGEHDD